MDYTVEPGKGVGALLFNITREQVHKILGGPDKSFHWTPQATDLTDAYTGLGISVHYDQANKLSMVEFVGPEVPTYEGTNLLTVDNPVEWLEGEDENAQIDTPDLTSDELNISFYLPPHGPRAVGVFRPGYYND